MEKRGKCVHHNLHNQHNHNLQAVLEENEDEGETTGIVCLFVHLSRLLDFRLVSPSFFTQFQTRIRGKTILLQISCKTDGSSAVSLQTRENPITTTNAHKITIHEVDISGLIVMH